MGLSAIPNLASLLDPEYLAKAWAARVNEQVAARFDPFAANLTLTPLQTAEAARTVAGVVTCLNREYWNITSAMEHRIVEGSWGKGTQCRPPRDVDVIFVLPYGTYQRFEARWGNKQSQLLQEIKETLAVDYETTRMRSDNQVVVVDFANGHGVEVVPAIQLTSGQYWICNTAGAGKYKVIDPVAEINAVTASDATTGGATRDLIRMMKRWQHWCNVPLKSFQLELLIIYFMPMVPYADGGRRSLRDYCVRDFFGYLVQRANTFVVVPGTYEVVPLGDAWLLRAQSAYERAQKASAFECREMPISAAQEWQKIFGTDIS